MNLNKDLYYAIIGDVVDSKKIVDRNNVQKQYLKVINRINKDYFNDISSGFQITSGDSFQGLLKQSDNILSIIEEIEDSMEPYFLRFGIGIGSINTDIVVENSSLIDGPAYHNARLAIESVKKRYLKHSDVGNIYVQSNKSSLDNLINSALSLCYVIKSNWTEKQKKVYNLSIKQNKNQIEIAKILNIKQPSVNSRLNASHSYIYNESIKNINKSFELFKGAFNEL